jgi:hypothetical protein
MRAAALALLVVPSLALGQGAARPAPSEGPARFLAPVSLGVRLGGLLAFSTPATGTPSAVGGGLYGLYDLQSLLADISADVYGGKDAFAVAGGLGVYWAILGNANVTPYVGGGARLAWAKFGGGGAFGLQIGGAVGIIASRHWSPHVRLELGWFFDTMAEQPSGGGSQSFPNGPLASIGLGF